MIQFFFFFKNTRFAPYFNMMQYFPSVNLRKSWSADGVIFLWWIFNNKKCGNKIQQTNRGEGSKGRLHRGRDSAMQLCPNPEQAEYWLVERKVLKEEYIWVNAVQALNTQREGRYKILQGWLGSTCTLTSSPQLSASWRPMAICFKGGGAPSTIRRPMWWVETKLNQDLHKLSATLQAAFQIPASILSLTQL